ncbi:MAG: hypothetical protein HQ536_04475, partial [Parcubacteria group bacterium]|nr:hypothetical protein [Parcubacteria group bacterium]
KVTSETRITNKIGFGRNPKIVWNGTDYGVAWWDSRAFSDTNYTKGALYYQKINAADSSIGNNIRVTTTSSSAFDPDFIWGNNEYAAVWADDRDSQSEIYFVRFDELGNILGTDDIRVTETEEDSLNPSLVWDGSSYGIIWQEKAQNIGSSGTHYEIYYQKINTAGEKVGDAVKLTTKDNGDSEAPSIVLNSDKYGIAWADYRGNSDKSQSDIYFMEINSDGVIITPEENVSMSESLSFEPSITNLSGEYILIYTDDRHGEYEMYSAKRK